MKPVFQTKFGADGNCLQAAIASLLELPLAAVPEFAEIGWQQQLHAWLARTGPLRAVIVDKPEGRMAISTEHLTISVGRRRRGAGGLHAFVQKGLSGVVHDPSPMPVDLSRGLEYVIIFASPDPAKEIAHHAHSEASRTAAPRTSGLS